MCQRGRKTCRSKLEISVTRLSDFLKFLVTNYLIKGAQINGDFWAILKSITSKKKLLWLVFGQILEKFGLLFISTCGHTESRHL